MKKAAHAPKRAKKAKPRALDPNRVLHELEVHQVELETQNEELRSARRDLEAALARYTDLFDYSPIGYVTLDAGGAIRRINHAGARLLETNRVRIVGTQLHRLLEPGQRGALDGLTARARRADTPATCELRVGGRILYVHASREPHEPNGLLLAFEDITQRKADEDQIARNMDDSRESNRRKDEFIAMLSHELRNPLAPIRTSFYVLANAEPGSRAMIEANEIAERQIAHLTRIVDDLLEVTRINSGKIRLQLERCDLVALVTETVDDHRPGLAAAGIAIGILAAPGPVWVEVDPARVVQVVSNLLGNAQKFTPDGGRVEVAVQERGGRAELRVRDTGTGILPELLPRVFEPFTQAPQSSDRSRGGLGLGLAMVKTLVELHHGSVAIRSEGNKTGTEVTVSLPLADAADVASGSPAAAVRQRRILVIEDQPDSARILDTALKMLGHVVRTVGTGAAGLDLARVFQPEIVLCDLGLPGMDGYEVARAFRRDRTLRDIYLVALSGYAQPEDVERTVAAGFSRHVAKPASMATLAKVIGDVP